MEKKEEQIVSSLEKRIEFYRRCMVWTFALGLLSGSCIFCCETTFLIPESASLAPCCINVLFCFFIALIGIATGSVYRRRIRYLMDFREKILMEFHNQRFFPKQAREGIITEMQVLFGILFLLSIVIVFIQYPIPKVPAFLGYDLVKIIPIIGFLGVCWISIWPERKNSLQAFLEGQNIYIRTSNNRPNLLQTFKIENGDFEENKISRLQT